MIIYSKINRCRFYRKVLNYFLFSDLPVNLENNVSVLCIKPSLTYEKKLFPVIITFNCINSTESVSILQGFANSKNQILLPK